MQAEYFALEGVSQLLTTIERVREPSNPSLEIEGIVLTMYDERMNLTRQVAEEVRTHFGEKVYRTVIPRNVRLSEAPSFGKPIILYDIRSRGSEAYINLAKEFIRRAENVLLMTQKKVLGRGLGALIPQRQEAAPPADSHATRTG